MRLRRPGPIERRYPPSSAPLFFLVIVRPPTIHKRLGDAQQYRICTTTSRILASGLTMCTKQGGFMRAPIPACLAALLLVAAVLARADTKSISYDAELAARVGADQYGMRQYVLVKIGRASL